MCLSSMNGSIFMGVIKKSWVGKNTEKKRNYIRNVLKKTHPMAVTAKKDANGWAAITVEVNLHQIRQAQNL